MHWLKEHGVIASYDDYLGLPIPVLEHAQLMMAAEVAHRKSENARAEQANRSMRRAQRR